MYYWKLDIYLFDFLICDQSHIFFPKQDLIKSLIRDSPI